MIGQLSSDLGWSATVTGYVPNRDGLAFLRLLAPPTAGKAFWAQFVGRKARQGKRLSMSIEWPGSQDTWVSLEKGVRYYIIRAELPSGYTDLAVIHPNATVNAGDTFYLITDDEAPPDEPPEAFFAMLNARLAAPLLPEWSSMLWREGLAGYQLPDESHWQTPRLVEQVTAYGVRAYRVRAGEDVTQHWLGAIRRGLGFEENGHAEPKP